MYVPYICSFYYPYSFLMLSESSLYSFLSVLSTYFKFFEHRSASDKYSLFSFARECLSLASLTIVLLDTKFIVKVLFSTLKKCYTTSYGPYLSDEKFTVTKIGVPL